jgi:hypothetical protein
MKTKKDRMYMIRHIPTNSFKVAGHNANFNSTGKLFRGGIVKSHLRLFQSYSHRRDRSLAEVVDSYWKPYYKIDDCEVVEIELVPIQSQPLREFIEQEMEKK